MDQISGLQALLISSQVDMGCPSPFTHSDDVAFMNSNLAALILGLGSCCIWAKVALQNLDIVSSRRGRGLTIANFVSFYPKDAKPSSLRVLFLLNGF